MITVLVVAERGRSDELDRIAAGRPSLELLHAAEVEEALDRLARNRRIDATLLLVEDERAADVARLLLEEDPAGPPLFVRAGGRGREVAGTRPLHGETPDELLAALADELSL